MSRHNKNEVRRPLNRPTFWPLLLAAGVLLAGASLADGPTDNHAPKHRPLKKAAAKKTATRKPAARKAAHPAPAKMAAKAGVSIGRRHSMKRSASAKLRSAAPAPKGPPETPIDAPSRDK